MSSSTEPKLSIIVPNYNHGALLPTCLKAIIEQSRRPFEILIIDDASKDNSIEVIAEFTRQYPWIKLYRNPENRGVVYNMNLGLQLAQGNYVYFAAADDAVLPGIFEKSLGLIAQHPQASLCCGICEWRDEQYGYKWHVGAGTSDKPCYLSPDTMVELNKKGALNIATHTVVFRKDALQIIGGFNPNLRWHTDWWAIQIIGFHYGICYYPDLFSIFNLSPTSYSQGTRSQQHQRVLSTMLDLLGKKEYQEAGSRIVASGALFEFGLPMLRLMLGHSQYRKFLNGCFLKKNLWYITKITVRKYLPASMATWYYRTFFTHQSSSNAKR